ncbi:MAG: hypothetical protein HKM23_09830 [Nitrosopumilus sp.]|nr:hypothetical protein [Nitrosopumilus sp.]NNL58952.1 hypothetical protein [Nitrosopumilus sp.]
MKVVGTKLDDVDYERFETFCMDKGISKSETMRGLIKQYCDDCENCSDEDELITAQDSEVGAIPEAKITSVSHDDGKTWIDVPELTNVRVGN